MMVRYKVKADKVDEVKEAVAEFVEAVQADEPDTLAYQSFQDANDPTVFIHYMIFDDEYAQTLHRKSSYVKKFVDVLYPLCAEDPVFTNLTLLRENRAG